MTERPIVLKAHEVRAILASEKTQMRLVLKPQPDHDGWVKYGETPSSAGSAYTGNATSGGICTRIVCPLGRPGDRLWVRETWQAIHVSIDPETGYGDDVWHSKVIPIDDDDGYWRAVYAASDPQANEFTEDRGFPWRPSIHMPRWASRITLEVTGVRVERLQEITEDDARAEGIAVLNDTAYSPHEPEGKNAYGSARGAFVAYWDSLAKPGVRWYDNPWVWVVSFKRV